MKKNNNEDIDKYLDFISGIILLIFGIYVLITGIFIAKKSTIGDIVWYGSPGIFPIFIGVIIVILAIILAIENLPKENNVNLIRDIVKCVDKNVVFRTLITIGLFAVYVFILIGRIPFYIATFVYLFITMLIFRENKFVIWKLLLISIIVTIIICLGFGKIANIPLP